MHVHSNGTKQRVSLRTELHSPDISRGWAAAFKVSQSLSLFFCVNSCSVKQIKLTTIYYTLLCLEDITTYSFCFGHSSCAECRPRAYSLSLCEQFLHKIQEGYGLCVWMIL